MKYKDWLHTIGKNYLELEKKLEEVLEKQDLDNVVPVLAVLLAEAGWMTGMDKKPFVAFVVGTIDRGYAEMEKRYGPRSDDKNSE